MKPIALFVEEGVEIKGLTSMEENRQMFSRDNLLQNVEQIIRYLCNLKETLELTKSYNPVLVRDYLHLEETFLKESVTQRCEVSMGSLVEELEATHHLWELDEKTPGLSIRPIEFSFKSLESPQGTSVGYTVVQDSDYKHLWRVTFTPPLKNGQKVKYAFKVVRPNIRPYTLEELMERVSRGTYKYKEPVCEACQWNIAYPTEEFRFRIEFPERYDISNCRVDVKMGEAGLRADHELRRIREGNMFIPEKTFDKWSLRLEIPGPFRTILIIFFMYRRPRINERRDNSGCDLQLRFESD